MKILRKIYILLLIFAVPVLFGMYPIKEQNTSGKIVFMEEDNVTATQGKETFDILDNIYVNVFLNNPLSYYYDQNDYMYNFDLKRFFYNYAIRIYDNDELKGQWLYEMPPDDFKTLQQLHFPLATDKEFEKRLYGNMVNAWVDLVNNMETGEHKIRMTVIPLYEDIKDKNPPIIAKGSFKLDVKSSQRSAFIGKYKTDLPEATIISPAIEEQIMDASENVIEGAEPIRAIITDVTGDWGYTYDEHGNIIYRHIVASVVYRLRSGECWVKAGYYSQKHKGFGNFGVMTFARDAEGYSDYEVDCDVVK